jgi:phenylacetate-coenzyme A ligase PaaK-like adenylate-forming protein
MNLNFLFPKTQRDFAAAQECWRSMQALGDADLLNLQLSKIQEVWRDAIRDVPYYGRLVEEGRAPVEIKSWSDFFKIPELTREILQDHKEEFVRRSSPPDLWRMTGGSTGNPVKFGVWTSEEEVVRVLKLVLWARVGYVPTDRLFLIWGHSHLLGTGWRRHWNHFLRKAKDAALGYKRVDAHNFSHEICKRYAEELLRYRPAGLIGYSAALDYFLRSLPERWEEFQALGLKFVMPCAEPAPRADSFELLGRVFGCPVIQEFGGVDFGHVGMKLGEGPFEVFGEKNFVEVAEPPMAADLTAIEHWGRCEKEQPEFGPKGEGVGTTESKSTEIEAGRLLAGQAGAAFSNSSTSELARDSENTSIIHSADGPASAAGQQMVDDRRLTAAGKDKAESGNLPDRALEAVDGDLKLNSYKLKTHPSLVHGAALVTSLYQRYLPLIRYRQGDVLGSPSVLSHGHVARFERLQGRVNDMVVLEDGTTIHSLAVAHCIRVEGAVLNMQMVLEDAGPRILLVTRDGLDEESVARIRHRLGQISEVLANVPIQIVQDLITTRAGKRRWIVDTRSNKH